MPDLNHGLDYQRDGQDGRRTPAGDAPKSRLDLIDQELHMQHWDTPQSASLAHFALTKIREGLTDLAKLGHDYHLVHGRELVTSVQEYPKMLTRASGVPLELTVEDEEQEEAARKQGYGFVGDVDGKAVPATDQPENPALQQIAESPVGSGAQPDPGALHAVVPEVLETPPENPPPATDLDKTIDGALGAPNNVSYEAPKPTVTDKMALERNKDAGVGASKPNSPNIDNPAKK